MSSTNKTTYYDLPQFVDNDIFNPLVDDNDAYDKIDTALHNIADAEADDASEIIGIKSRLDSAEGDIDALEAQNGNSILTTTAQTLSGAVNELDADTSALDGRLDIVEDDINNVSTGLKSKVSANTTDIAALKVQNGNSVLTTLAQTLSGAINELKNTTDNLGVFVTPQMFKDYAGDDWTNAINSALSSGVKLVYFPAGIYNISSELDIECSVIMHDDAYIKPSVAMGCCVHVNKTYTPSSGGYPLGWKHNQLLKLNVDCDNLASTGIRTDQFSWASCDFTVINPTSVGVFVGYTTSAGDAETNFKIKVACDNDHANNATGVIINSADHTFDDIYIDNVKYGVDIRAFCIIKQIHHWIASANNFNGSVSLNISERRKCYLGTFYWDTVETGIKITGEALTGVFDISINQMHGAVNTNLITTEQAGNTKIIDCTGINTTCRNNSRIHIGYYMGNDVYTSGNIKFGGDGICPNDTTFNYSNDYLTVNWNYSLDYCPQGQFMIPMESLPAGSPSTVTSGVWAIKCVNNPYGKIQELDRISNLTITDPVKLVMTATNPVDIDYDTCNVFMRRFYAKYTGKGIWGKYASIYIENPRTAS